MAKKFPEFIFVSFRGNSGDEYLDAQLKAADSVEDDGPTKVATYRLVEISNLSKRVVSSKAKTNAA